MTDEEALPLHDRAALGESFTEEERAQLDTWYAAQDAAEARDFAAARSETAGERKAVLIDLRRHRELWEDFYDTLLAHERAGEPRESLAEVKKKVLG